MKNILCPICREVLSDTSPKIVKCNLCDAVILTRKEEAYYSNIDTISFARMEKNFSEAVYLSKQMIQSNKFDSLSHWLMFLSKFGITYMKTPLSKKRVPTFSKSIDNVDFLQDPDYLKAIGYEQNDEIKDYYISQEKLINELYKKISILTSRCKYNDIYISAKRYNRYTDENGNLVSELTDDYKKAIETYHSLKKLGYNVFFSHIDAQGTIDEIEFSAIIHSIISHSKLFLLFATKLEHIEAPAIKDDWYKYIFFMRNKIVPNNSLIYTYKCEDDKPPYTIPQELHSFRSLNYNKPNYINELVNLIKISIPDSVKALQVKKLPLTMEEITKREVIIKKSFSNPKPLTEEEKNLITDGLKYLRNVDFNNASEIFEKLKNLNNENFMAYLGKILLKARAINLSDLTTKKLFSIDDFGDLEIALKYADTINGKKIIDKICLSLKQTNTPNNADKIVWIYYIIAPYIDDNQKLTLEHALNNILENYVRKNAITKSAKIFGLICNLTQDKPIEENKYYSQYVNLLMSKKKFDACKNILIEISKVYENADVLLKLLKCTLKTNTFEKYILKHKLKPIDNNNPNSYSVSQIISKILTIAYYTNNLKPVDELRMLCYTQIENFNIKVADKLISHIVSYMLPLYPCEIIVKFLLKCSNKFSNSGAFDLAIKYSSMVINYTDKNCQAYFEILRAKMKAYDDYDFINYNGIINEIKEFKQMYSIAEKNNNTALIKRIDLLLKYHSQPKEFKTTKAFPRKNYKKKRRNKFFKKIFLVLCLATLVTFGVLIYILISNSGLF